MTIILVKKTTLYTAHLQVRGVVMRVISFNQSQKRI